MRKTQTKKIGPQSFSTTTNQYTGGCLKLFNCIKKFMEERREEKLYYQEIPVGDKKITMVGL